MILAIDIGNTQIVIGCIEDKKVVFKERVATDHSATRLQYASMIKTAFDMYKVDTNKLEGAIISSVVPTVTNNVKQAIEKYAKIKVIIVEPGIKTGISIKIDNPAQLGSDLLVSAVAGVAKYKAPLIIIDMGTATTISVINKNKEYIGGSILPGLVISHDALVNRTSKLQGIALDAPKKVIGTNTNDCIKSGLMYGNAGALDGIIEHMKEQLNEDCTVVATGGLSQLVVPLCKSEIILDDELLLKGLMILYEKNTD